MTLKTLIELQEKATPGPWEASRANPNRPGYFKIDAEMDAVFTTTFCYADEPEQNAAFIAAARNFDFAALDRRIREMDDQWRNGIQNVLSVPGASKQEIMDGLVSVCEQMIEERRKALGS